MQRKPLCMNLIVHLLITTELEMFQLNLRMWHSQKVISNLECFQLLQAYINFMN